MDYAQLDENNVVINILYFDPAYGCSEQLKTELNLVYVNGYPVYHGDTYNFEEQRFYRNGEIVLSYQEELEMALHIILMGVDANV